MDRAECSLISRILSGNAHREVDSTICNSTGQTQPSQQEIWLKRLLTNHIKPSRWSTPNVDSVTVPYAENELVASFSSWKRSYPIFDDPPSYSPGLCEVSRGIISGLSLHQLAVLRGVSIEVLRRQAIQEFESLRKVLERELIITARIDVTETDSQVSQSVTNNKQHFQNRLREIMSLQDGWLDGEGLAPKMEELNWLSQMFERYYPTGLLLPFIFPTTEGNIQAEWSLECVKIALEISLQSHLGEWVSLNTDTNNVEMLTFLLDEEKEWNALVEKISQMIAGT